MGVPIPVASGGFTAQRELVVRDAGVRRIDQFTQGGEGPRDTRIRQPVRAHGQRIALGIRNQIGGGLEPPLHQLTGFLLMSFVHESDPACQLRLDPIGNHLGGLGEQLALPFQLDDLLAVEDFIEPTLLGQRVAP